MGQAWERRDDSIERNRERTMEFFSNGPRDIIMASPPVSYTPEAEAPQQPLEQKIEDVNMSDNPREDNQSSAPYSIRGMHV